MIQSLRQKYICHTKIDCSYTHVENDYKFLIKEIGSRNTVVLGECLHSDGSTFNVKTQIIKLLHENLGFNKIIFEASRIDLWMRTEKIENRASAKANHIYKFWADAAEMVEFWDYVDSSNIKVYGMDIQSSSVESSKRILDTIFEYLTQKNIETTNICPNLYAIADSLQFYINIETNNAKLGNDKRLKIFNEIETIINIMQPEKDRMYEYIVYLHGLKMWWDCVSNYTVEHSERFALRDSLMFDNFCDQINLLDEKVIVWTSNMHAAKKTSFFYNGYNYLNFGERMNQKFGPNVYTILFTSYCYCDNSGKTYDYAPVSSLEQSLYQERYSKIFLNYDNLKNIDTIKCGVNQRLFFRMPIHQITDALFYIDTMKQVTYGQCD